MERPAPNGRCSRSPTRKVTTSADVFCTGKDIDACIAEHVVGDLAHRDALLVLRATNKRFRSLIDSYIDVWGRNLMNLRIKRQKSERNSDEYFQATVDAEILIEKAFGPVNGSLKTFFNLSMFNKENYLAALIGKCALCGNRMYRRSYAEDSAHTHSQVPAYVFAHPCCLKKHMVTLASGNNPISRALEPRELQKEIAIVEQMHPAHLKFEVGHVTAHMSMHFFLTYFSLCNNGNNDFTMLVWLRPHPLVEAKDTLYGAFGITDANVKECIDLLEAQKAHMARQAKLKRQWFRKRMKDIKLHFFGEMRTWLGKGYTRWRSFDDVLGFHPQILSSMGLNETYVDAMHHTKRHIANSNFPYPACLIFFLLDLTIKQVHDDSGGVIDYLISSLTLDFVFGWVDESSTLFELQFLDTKSDVTGVQRMINAEAAVVAAVLNALSNIQPGDIMFESFSRSAYSPRGSTTYDVNVALYVTGVEDRKLVVYSRFTVGHEEICKLKFAAGKLMTSELASTMPRVPVTDEADAMGDFFSSVVKTCFATGSGKARSKALSFVVTRRAFMELKDCIGHSVVELWASDEDGDGSRSEDL